MKVIKNNNSLEFPIQTICGKCNSILEIENESDLIYNSAIGYSPLRTYKQMYMVTQFKCPCCGHTNKIKEESIY